jgi:hypothetical protein
MEAGSSFSDRLDSELKPKDDQWKQMVDLFYQRTNLHIGLVNKYAQIIYERFPEVCAELVTNAHQHDDSKYQRPEFVPYVYLTWGKQNNMDFTVLCDSMYECLNCHGFETPQDIKNAISKATFHHITVNKHHPEFHSPQKIQQVAIGETPPIVVATGMDILSLAEMCADWAAMSEELGTNVVDWAYENINRWRFNPNQKRQIADFLTACVKNG